jgi:hypothetical protein
LIILICIVFTTIIGSLLSISFIGFYTVIRICTSALSVGKRNDREIAAY